MSISTTNTFRPKQGGAAATQGHFTNQNYFENNNSRPHYAVKELFNIEDDSSVEYPDDDQNIQNSKNVTNENKFFRT